MATIQMKAEKYLVRFDDDDKSIFIEDLTDTYNGTSGYNKLKRNYKKAKEAMIFAIEAGDKSTFWQWIRALDEHYKLRMHTYCAID